MQFAIVTADAVYAPFNSDRAAHDHARDLPEGTEYSVLPLHASIKR